MRHSWIRSVGAATVALLVAGGVAVNGAPSVQADQPARLAPYADTAGMTHWVGEFEPGSDLEHYADWVLDKVGVGADEFPSRKPNGYLFTELSMVWLLLSPEEAGKANGLIGQSPMVAAETTSVVSLPTPVAEQGGPLSAPGQAGFETVPTGIARIGTPDWTTERPPSMSGVKVAVVDTGTFGRHDDLPRLAGSFNCSQDNRGTEATTDPHGHSTHVTGTIAAEHDDSYVVGVAPSVDIYSIAVFGEEGSASGAMVLCGLNKALEFGADVANFSLGGGHVATSCGGSSVYTNGYCRAIAKGLVIVAAAGNEPIDGINHAPGSVPGVVTVGAIIDFDGEPGGRGLGFPGCGLGHRDDYWAVFSSWGSVVDVAAPGGCILSTLPGNNWGFSSGTSMATPHVVGVIANFMARYPDCRGPRAVKAVLDYATQYTRNHPEYGYDGYPGAEPPPLIRYIGPDRAPTTNPDADPCKIPTEAQS